MKKTVSIGCSSDCFHIAQPSTYSRSEEIYGRETRENDYWAEETKKDENWKPGTYSIDGQKYLDNYLAEGWYDAFEGVLENRDKLIKIEVVRKGTHSPREHNFYTDCTNFDLILDMEDLERIRKEVFKHEEIFGKYLDEYQSSYSSFWSFMPNTIYQWKEAYAGIDEAGSVNTTDAERAVWCLLEFWLFAFEQGEPSMRVLRYNLRSFEEAYEYALQDLDSNGVLYDCLDFEECKIQEFRFVLTFDDDSLVQFVRPAVVDNYDYVTNWNAEKSIDNVVRHLDKLGRKVTGIQTLHVDQYFFDEDAVSTDDSIAHLYDVLNPALSKKYVNVDYTRLLPFKT